MILALYIKTTYQIGSYAATRLIRIQGVVPIFGPYKVAKWPISEEESAQIRRSADIIWTDPGISMLPDRSVSE